jgi:hypothetical protein
MENMSNMLQWNAVGAAETCPGQTGTECGNKTNNGTKKILFGSQELGKGKNQ